MRFVTQVKQQLTTFVCYFCHKYKVLLVNLFTCVLFICRSYISTLFENDRHFSHLSTLEREMGFRTEMVCFYSKCINVTVVFYMWVIALAYVFSILINAKTVHIRFKKAKIINIYNLYFYFCKLVSLSSLLYIYGASG